MPLGGAAGGTTVSDEVVEKIAAAAARAVPGVAELGGDVARFFNTVLDKIGLDQVGDARRGLLGARHRRCGGDQPGHW